MAVSISLSLVRSCSILRMECSTVVWCFPPKSPPIWGKERFVSLLHRYIANWRGRAIRGELFLERSEDQADREAFGLDQADSTVSVGEQIAEAALASTDTPMVVERSANSSEGSDSDSSVESRVDGDSPLDTTGP